MPLYKMTILFTATVLFLSGCSIHSAKEQPIYKKTAEIQSLVDRSQWSQAKKELKAVENLFKKNHWKYQLLADEPEYRGLQDEISKLQISLDEKDKKEAKTSAVLIQNYLEAIYYK